MAGMRSLRPSFRGGDQERLSVRMLGSPRQYPNNRERATRHSDYCRQTGGIYSTTDDRSANAKRKRIPDRDDQPQAKRRHYCPRAFGKAAAGGDRYCNKREHDRSIGLAERAFQTAGAAQDRPGDARELGYGCEADKRSDRSTRERSDERERR
jgi:hypothetical protein